MRDESPQKYETIKVRSDRDEGPYVVIATSQVPQVQVLLDGVGLTYTVTENSELASVDECPMSTIVFKPDISCDEIQRVLDEFH